MRLLETTVSISIIAPGRPESKDVKISVPMFSSAFVKLLDLFVNTGESVRAFERAA